MSAKPRHESPRAVLNEEGVVVARSAADSCVCLPRPVSANHQLSIAKTLWDVWVGTPNAASDDGMDWIANVSTFDELPSPLSAVLAAFDADLGQAGRSLQVMSQPTNPASFAMGKPEFQGGQEPPVDEI